VDELKSFYELVSHSFESIQSVEGRTMDEMFKVVFSAKKKEKKKKKVNERR
jgi:hypothetical protein